MAKFLIIRFSSIGDIVLTTPVIRCLRKQYPDAEIHFLTKDSFRSIVANNPYIDKIHILADSCELMIHELKQKSMIILLTCIITCEHFGSKRFLKNVKSFSFNKLNVEKYILPISK